MSFTLARARLAETLIQIDFSKIDLNHFKLNGMYKDSYDVVRSLKAGQ